MFKRLVVSAICALAAFASGRSRPVVVFENPDDLGYIADPAFPEEWEEWDEYDEEWDCEDASSYDVLMDAAGEQGLAVAINGTHDIHVVNPMNLTEDDFEYMEDDEWRERFIVGFAREAVRVYDLAI